MDKKTFIAELERSLSVLQEEELRDIVGEYEQHIDMKVQSGLTEEEAIADFGSVKELTAEILEAYHVRADFASAAEGKAEKKWELPFAKSGKTKDAAAQQTKERLTTIKQRITGWLKRAGAWFLGAMKLWDTQEMREKILHRDEAKHTDEFSYEGKAGNVARSETHGCFTSVQRAAEQCTAVLMEILRFCWRGALWCVRIGWNLCWIGFSCFCGAMGLFCLFGLGTLVVLLTQGYPLAGVTIGCLGLNLCLFSIAGLGMTLLWKKKKKEIETVQEVKADA
ncbi:MAG: DUF1700 domain-containing protein [Lachnospiraceae bacterium]|nr:DUF1700 domain-containing protein [Lachnospiraceae bacterium]